MLIHLKRKQGASIFEVNRDKLGTIFATASRVICFFVIALTICGKLVDQVLMVGREKRPTFCTNPIWKTMNVVFRW
jgi:hypothetical protein